jgi:hypothetical protein
MNIETKQYLGDSIYVDYDGFGFTLSLRYGITSDAQIYLDPEVYFKLTQYAEKMQKLANDLR